MASDAQHVLIGIDDTDNLDSRGTGFLTLQLRLRLAREGIAQVVGITRHQLLFDRRIPYTRHNGALCLEVKTGAGGEEGLAACCRDHLLQNCAPGSDAGLCIAPWSAVGGEVQDFGVRAKTEILQLADAIALGRRAGFLHEGLTGDHGGMIGALSAVGLHRRAKDGRVVWRPGVRETTGIITAEALLRTTGIDAIRSLCGDIVATNARIDVRPWPRPVVIEGQVVLLVEKGRTHDATCDWRLAPRHVLRRY